MNIEATTGRPPHGGRGLKFVLVAVRDMYDGGRPPHGGRGLKCLSYLLFGARKRRPPHGGRGLK